MPAQDETGGLFVGHFGSQAALEPGLARLTALTRDNPAQQVRIGSLKANLEARMALALRLAGTPDPQDAATARVRRGPGAALDLSGIAKGFGVDLAAEHLLASGVRHFLIEVGGELRGEGVQPDGQPWWVDVESPPGLSLAPWRLALHDLSVATSGNYRRGFTEGDRHYSHSFDPRSGRPIVNGVASVTVVHRSCMIADGWATALTIVGPERGIALADAQGLAASMIADGREYASREWCAMLD